MGLFDDLEGNMNVHTLAQVPDSSGESQNLPTFIDADTIRSNGISYRLQGWDAPEIQKIVKDDEGQAIYKQGTAGGGAATGIISNLANKNGYTNIVPLLDENGNVQKDEYGRVLADLQDSSGRSFKEKVLSSGIFNTTKYSGDMDKLIASSGKFDRAWGDYDPSNDYEVAEREMRIAELKDGAKSYGFKKTARNELELAQANAAGYEDFYQQNTVSLRSRDRTISNESMHPMKDSWEQGWLGLQEGAYGFLEMSGEKMGSDYLETLGEDGVNRARVWYYTNSLQRC